MEHAAGGGVRNTEAVILQGDIDGGMHQGKLHQHAVDDAMAKAGAGVDGLADQTAEGGVRAQPPGFQGCAVASDVHCGADRQHREGVVADAVVEPATGIGLQIHRNSFGCGGFDCWGIGCAHGSVEQPITTGGCIGRLMGP